MKLILLLSSQQSLHQRLRRWGTRSLAFALSSLHRSASSYRLSMLITLPLIDLTSLLRRWSPMLKPWRPIPTLSLATSASTQQKWWTIPSLACFVHLTLTPNNMLLFPRVADVQVPSKKLSRFFNQSVELKRPLFTWLHTSIIQTFSLGFNFTKKSTFFQAMMTVT